MTPTEAAKLLALAGTLDRRIATREQASAWALVLGNLPYKACEQAVIEHFRDPKTREQYLTTTQILNRVEQEMRLRKRDVEVDVRAAKARGIVTSVWPDDRPLTADLAQQLQEARDADRDTFEQLGIEA